MNWETLRKTQPTAANILTGSFRKGRMAHAYLFQGNKGTGKRETAFLFAKRYFCREANGLEPCGGCRDCRRIDSGNHPDVHVIAPDGLSIKKEQVTDLLKEFSYRGVESRRKLYILQHADKMTIQAGNSLLKFLEEPGMMTCAVLITEQIQQMLATVISRCQVVSFTPPAPKTVEAAIDHPDAAVKKAAARLTNSVEEAQALCADEWFAQARKIVIQLTEGLRKRPHETFIFLEDQWHAHFHNKNLLQLGLDLLLLWYRDVMFFHFGKSGEVVYTDQRKRLEDEGVHSSGERAAAQMTAVLGARRRLDANVSPELVMEQLVWKLQEGSSHVSCDRYPV
ncbi:MAG TPA: DNA polymerase III subunit delta' [Bacillales bacterium]|nr:DNA polymerase III subunit delta' [Bacillales bacterium]